MLYITCTNCVFFLLCYIFTNQYSKNVAMRFVVGVVTSIVDVGGAKALVFSGTEVLFVLFPSIGLP